MTRLKFLALSVLFGCWLWAASVAAQEPSAIPVETPDDSAPAAEASATDGSETDVPVDDSEPIVEWEDGSLDEDGVEVEIEDDATAPPIEDLPGTINFSGILKERGTRRLLSDITVYLKGTDRSATSDQNAYFEFRGLPTGTYAVIVPSMNYENFETEETIVEGEAVEVVYYLEPKIYGNLEVVVRGKKIKKEVSRKTISIEELTVIPGTLGDAVRVVENMPGVARGGTSSQGVVIRGSNAEDSRTIIDGHEIPQLFHFGGLKSVYNSDLLKEVSLYQGGFGAEFGNATGGIVELKTKRPKLDQWGGYVDTSLLDVTALAEGPIIDDMGIAFAFRRSMIDLILPAVLPDSDDFSFTTLPVYYDYQFKWDWQINKNHYVSVDWYGGLDKLELVSNLVNDSEPEFTGNIGFETMFHSVFAHYVYDDDFIRSDFSPGFRFQSLKAYIGKEYYFNLDSYVPELYEDLTFKFSTNHNLHVGAQIEPRTAHISSNLTRPPKEGDVDYSFSNSEKIQTDQTGQDWLVGFYIYDELAFDPVLIVPGLRVDYYSEIDQYAVSPRLNLRYQVIDQLALKTAVGLYQRIPDPDEVFEPFGNDNLDYERAVHTVAGFEWDILPFLSLDVQGYYKYLDKLVNADENPSNPDDFYANNAKGYVVGGEVMLRHNMANNFFGWISYSVSRAMRNDGPGTPYRFFDMDQTHNLVIVASYQFLKTWRIGGRFQFTSGEPYTDINGSIMNADNGTFLPIYDKQNKSSERFEPYHRLDIRLDKDWVFNTWKLTTYLDVQSVYYRSNTIGVNYNYDYSERVDFKNLPILPSIGLRAEF